MNYYLKVLKNYATFTGRARRSEYWYFVLFNTIISLILKYAGIAAGFPLLSSIYSLAVFIPYMAVAVRRKHDIGKSGWYSLIPIYNLIIDCFDGDPGDNAYGEDPKGRPSFGADDYIKPYDPNPEV